MGQEEVSDLRKTKYEMVIGKKPSRRSAKYYFNYGASKDICFQLTKGGAVLFYSSVRDYSDNFMDSHAYYLMREEYVVSRKINSIGNRIGYSCNP